MVIAIKCKRARVRVTAVAAGASRIDGQINGSLMDGMECTGYITWVWNGTKSSDR